jgi:spore maturation protein CgeB
MRIFYAVEYESRAGSRLWYNNLYLSLIDLGHEVHVFDYPLDPHYRHNDPHIDSNKIFIRENRPRLEEALLNQIERLHREKPIDVFFSYFYNSHCRPQAIHEIRRLGIITVNWYCNASYQFEMVKEIAPAYNYCLVPEKFRLAEYHRIGANPIYCQEAANPNIYKPYPLPREFDVIFVGQKYGDRPFYIRRLLDDGINVRVWGSGWQARSTRRSLFSRLKKLANVDGWRRLARKVGGAKRSAESTEQPVVLPKEVCGPPLTDEDMVKMFSRSKINLGFSSCGDTHRTQNRILQVRLRDFEAPMSGAFYMVEYMEELEEFFKIGKEIVCYHDPADLVDKVKYYLAHDTERERIQQAGYQRALRDHTWQKRLAEAFRTMGLLA